MPNITFKVPEDKNKPEPVAYRGRLTGCLYFKDNSCQWFCLTVEGSLKTCIDHPFLSSGNYEPIYDPITITLT